MKYRLCCGHQDVRVLLTAFSKSWCCNGLNYIFPGFDLGCLKLFLKTAAAVTLSFTETYFETPNCIEMQQIAFSFYVPRKKNKVNSFPSNSCLH